MVRNMEPKQSTARPITNLDMNSNTPQHEPRSRAKISRLQFELARSLIKGFQRKKYQHYLEPLDMPALKIYNKEQKEYDHIKATSNKLAQRSTNPTDVLSTFMTSRTRFYSMLDLLVELTPKSLKNEATLLDQQQLEKVLHEQDMLYQQNKFSVPQYNFHEVPPIPNPLTKDSFTEYIYFLTHVRMPYKNSLSLLSGIIPEILLNTHLLDNDVYKPFRSTDTYNSLIHYFGYEKKQSSFARELLLVMAKDGHSPNVDTMNELLKICRVHSKSKFLVSTYTVVANYLKIMKNRKMEPNLTTWVRIYECISNIFLREVFINRMVSINLPILDHFSLRILDDFSSTTSDTNEVINFIEKNLRRHNWKSDPRYSGRVLAFMVKHSRNNEDLSMLWDRLNSYAIDGVSVKNIIGNIGSHNGLRFKTYLALKIYFHFKSHVNPDSAEILTRVIQIATQDRIEISKLSFIVRCLIHHEAVEVLSLPVELDMKTNQQLFCDSEEPKPKIYEFPFDLPRGNFPEHYRILKRMTRNHLTDFEAKTILLSENNKEIRMPWEMLNKNELNLWEDFKAVLSKDDQLWLNTEKKASILGLQEATEHLDKELVQVYRKINNIRKGLNHDVNLMTRLQNGYGAEVENEMRERGILPQHAVDQHVNRK